jgi:hypothetical protein
VLVGRIDHDLFTENAATPVESKTSEDISFDKNGPYTPIASDYDVQLKDFTTRKWATKFTPFMSYVKEVFFLIPEKEKLSRAWESGQISRVNYEIGEAY